MTDNVKSPVEQIKDGIAEVKQAHAAELKTATESFEAKTAELANELKAANEKIEKMAIALNRPAVEGGEAVSTERKEAFVSYLRTGVEAKALSTDKDPDGGYLVDNESANFVVDRVFETSPLRQVARVVTTSAKSLEVTIDDEEAAAGWVGERETQGETSTPQVGQKLITAHILEARAQATTSMLEDSAMDVEGWLNMKVAEKFGRLENTAFVSGDGVTKPRGFLTYAAWASAGVYERNKIEQITSTASTAGTINKVEDLIDLQGALKEEYQNNAVWVMKRSTWTAVKKIQDGSGQQIGLENMALKGKIERMLLGSPVILADDMPALSAGSLSVAYGDFSRAYTIIDRRQISVLRDPYSAKPKVEFYTTKRTGGDVTNFDAIKLLVTKS